MYCLLSVLMPFMRCLLSVLMPFKCRLLSLLMPVMPCLLSLLMPFIRCIVSVLKSASWLPQEHEIREHHRRDGFEVGNADKIFESTAAARSKPSAQPMAGYGKDLQLNDESGQFESAKA